MLSPKKVKFKKMHKTKLNGKTLRNNRLIFGNCGIQALESFRLSSKLIETIKKTILRYSKKKTKIWIKIFPDRSLTLRSKDSRMGSGKGAVKNWIALIYPGVIFFELKSFKQKLMTKLLPVLSDKFPINTKIIYKKFKSKKKKLI